eukprot:GSChrysophyteH1.ASY1.ANO1.1859.1 assembled CDS
MCVIRWNGSEVGRTGIVFDSRAPIYNETVLIRVPPVWTIHQCELEVAVHGEPTLTGGLGVFLGQANIRGDKLTKLLSGSSSDGILRDSVFVLNKSDHFPDEDQKLVGGLIKLRGHVDFEREGEYSKTMKRQEDAATNANAFGLIPILDADIEKIVSTRRMEVNVLECTELMQMDNFGTANAFVTLIWNGRERGSTKVCHNELNPTWENETIRLPIPADLMLTDCVLEFKVENVSRMGTISFLGHHVVTGENLERLAMSNGDPIWYDLQRNRYYDDTRNAKCQGALRVSCMFYGDDGIAYVPKGVANTYQPKRIKLSLQSITCVGTRVGIPKMTLVTSRFQPYLQFVWNGSEAGCSSHLNISYGDLNYHHIYLYLNEEFSFIIPDNKPLSDCTLEIYMWDKGAKEASGADSFCGMKALTGLELHYFVTKCTDTNLFRSRESLIEYKNDSSLSLGKSWELPEEVQKNAKALVSIVANYLPEVDAEILEVEELPLCEEVDEESHRVDDAIEVYSDQFLSEVSPSHSDMVSDTGIQLSEEEKKEIIELELDEYWQGQKEMHKIIIPDGAESYFTKHYDESLGKFYFYDHVSGLTTWDKPVGKIDLYLSDEQIDNIRQKHERSYKSAFNQSPEKDTKDVRHLVLDKMRKEKELEIKQHKARLKAELEQKNKNIWQRALIDADMSGGHLSLTWQNMGVIDPVVFQFNKNFGTDLQSLRLIGVDLKELPEQFGLYLTQLKFLNLSNNKLTYLPESFVQMSSVVEINLLKNQLTCLPDRIGLLCHLEKLEIANNCITQLPITFAALNMISRIDIECNKLCVLPENLDNLMSCHTLICNNNELLRLPRCIGAMPSLTSLSATHNKISYIPEEITECETLKVLRLSLNKISKIPDKVGNLRKLRELSIDYNLVFKLPMSFYKLGKLRTLRLEGNENLTDPPPDIIGAGAQAVVLYYKKKFEEDVTWRQRVIISSVQAVLGQAYDRGITDPSQFEPNTKVAESDDGWYAIQLSYFWTELLPEMKQIWRDEGLRNIQNPNWVNSFPFNEKEVLWAFSNFSDAYGMMLKRQKVQFRRCACVDANGRRKPCVPPAVGFMCYRVATLLKMHFVMSGQRKERLWIAYKKSGIEEAVKTAEDAALKYLHSSVGKLWLETEAYKQAEITLNAMGGEAEKEWRVKALDRKQAAIIAHYDRKKALVESVRDKKAAVIQEELDLVKDEWKKAKEGYMKTTLEAQMQELIKKLASMDENIHLERLTLECDRKCKDAVDVIYDAESSDSSDSDVSLPDSEDESDLAQLRRERYIRRHEEQLENEKLLLRKNKLGPMPKSHIEYAIDKAKEKIYPITSIILPYNRAREKHRYQMYKKLKKSISHVIDVVDIRLRKFYMKVGGNFDEIQKEAKHELYRQYLESNIEQARSRAKGEFDVIDQVRQSMGGVGVEKVFKAWKRWALNKLQRLRRDARAEFRTSTLAFNASMESVEIAQARVDMWKKCKDIYTEKPFWVNTLTKEVTDERPGLQHFLPPSFEMPPPPKPLPAGVSLDTSSDESEHAFRKMKKISKRAASKKETRSTKDKKKRVKNDLDGNADRRLKPDLDNGSIDDDSISGNDSDMSSSSATETTASSPMSANQNDEGKFCDDISALSDVSGMDKSESFSKQPLDLSRRNSDAAQQLQSPRMYTSVHEKDVIGAEDMSIRSQFAGTSRVSNSFKSVDTGSFSHSSGYSYGPDSLRMSKGGLSQRKPFFEENLSTSASPTQLELRVQEARRYIQNLVGTEQEQKKVDYSIQPSDVVRVHGTIRLRAEEETNIADRAIRKKRSMLSVARHQTYINQANRIPRSMEENVARRKAREAEQEEYTKPDLEQLLDLAGGDERMTNVPGKEGTHLRTILAHRALHIEKKAHDKAVKKNLADPKPWSFVGHYIAPIWRENAINSDDDDSDGEEERREKRRRKDMRAAERRALAQKIIDDRNGDDDQFSVSVPSVDTKIPLEERMGKPRSKQIKSSPVKSL